MLEGSKAACLPNRRGQFFLFFNCLREIAFDCVKFVAYRGWLKCRVFHTLTVSEKARPAPRQALVLVRVCNEAVADASHREQMDRLGGIVFDVAPQADHEVVDGPGVGVFVQTPDLLQD